MKEKKQWVSKKSESDTQTLHVVGQGRGSVWNTAFHSGLLFPASFLAGVHQRTGWVEEQENSSGASELLGFCLFAVAI